MVDRLLEYLPDPNTIKGGLAEVVEVVQREAPLVVQELINWAIVYDLCWFIGSALCFIVVFVLLKKYTWKWANEFEKEADYGESGCGYFLGIGCPIAFLLVCFALFALHWGWLKPLIAPRLFLLEYFANMVK